MKTPSVHSRCLETQIMISFTLIVLLAWGSEFASAAKKGMLDLGEIDGLVGGGDLLKGGGIGGGLTKSVSGASSSSESFSSSGGGKKIGGLPDIVNLDMASSASKASSGAFSKSGGKKGGTLTLGGMVPNVVTGIAGGGSKSSSFASSSSSSSSESSGKGYLGKGWSGMGDASMSSAASAAAASAASAVGFGGLSKGSEESGGGGGGGVVEVITGKSLESSSSEECDGEYGILDKLLGFSLDSSEEEGGCKGGFGIKRFIRLFLRKDAGEKCGKLGFFKFPFFKKGFKFFGLGSKLFCKYLQKGKSSGLIGRFLGKILQSKGLLGGSQCESFSEDFDKEAENSECDESSDNYLKGIFGCAIRVFGKYGITFKKAYEDWIKLFYGTIIRLSKQVC